MSRDNEVIRVSVTVNSSEEPSPAHLLLFFHSYMMNT